MELITNDLKVTSLQIAEYSNRSHSNVTRLIRKEFGQIHLDLSSYSGTYINAQNKEQTLYVLPKKELMFIISKFDAELRWKILSRLEELENVVNIPKETIEQFVPKSGFMEENKKGMLRTKPVSGYWRVDKDTEENRLLHKRYELNKQLNGLFIEDIKSEIALIDNELKALEG